MLRCLAPSLRYQACVGATRVRNSCVCDLCRVLVRLSHPQPSVVMAPVYRGCPARDPVSRVRPSQSANSCCACWCAVVRRTRRRVVSVERPVLTFVGFPLTPLLDMVTAVVLSVFGETPRTTCGSLHSPSRLISIRLHGWSFCWLCLKHEILCMT